MKCKSVMRELVLDCLNVDHSYQRPLDVPRAERISKDFDVRLFRTPMVARRVDGSYWILDGQTRTAAAKLAGRGGTRAMCEVFSGLTHKDEAELFLELNNRKHIATVKSVDKFKARIEADEPTARTIADIVGAYGWRLSTNGGKGTIAAIDAIEHAFKKGVLGPVLETVTDWQAGNPKAVSSTIVRALACFYESTPNALSPVLSKRLALIAPDVLEADIKRSATGRTILPRDVLGANVLRSIYNKGTRKGQMV